MKAKLEEITIWIDESGSKAAFRRMKKSESMQKMSIEELKELVYGDDVLQYEPFVKFWMWLLDEADNESSWLAKWLGENLNCWRAEHGNIR